MSDASMANNAIENPIDVMHDSPALKQTLAMKDHILILIFPLSPPKYFF